MIALHVNDQPYQVDAEAGMPLLWALRDLLNLTGTKFGCGAGLCGACTVHLDGSPVRSCQTSVGDAAGRHVVTIEGLSRDRSHPVQKAWIAEQVPQCGFCQSGMIMAVAGLLAKISNPTDEQVGEAITNICRCGTYPRVKAAIQRAATA